MSSRADRSGLPDRLLGRLFAVAATVLLLLLAAAGPASAHAVLISTDPVDGVVLAQAPTSVTATFGESVRIESGALRVFGPDGRRYDRGTPQHGPGGPSTVTVGLRSGLPQGSYLVAWAVISADTHPVSGAFRFSIGHVSALAVPGDVVSPSHQPWVLLHGTARWLAYVGVSLFAAGMLFRARRPAAWGWWLLFASTGAVLLLQEPYSSGNFNPWLTLHTTVGRLLAGRLLLLLLCLPVMLNRRLAARATPLTVVVPGMAFALTWSLTGHSSVGSGSAPVALSVAADGAHLLAAAVWMGGLAVLALQLRAPRPQDPQLDRFSRTAFNCVAVLAVTGLYQAMREIDSWRGLFGTDYGRLLLAKLAGVLLLLALGARARVLLRRRAASESDDGSAPERALRRGVLLEVAVGAAVLGLTAALVASSPAVARPTAGQASAPPAVPFDTGGVGGAGRVVAGLAEHTAGPNSVLVDIEDPLGQPMATVQVTAALYLPAEHLGPLPVPLVNSGIGHYFAADVSLTLPGAWQLLVTVRTDAIDETTVLVPVTVSSGS